MCWIHYSCYIDESSYMCKAHVLLISHNFLKVSYMILARVSPVTHSVGNCVKRVVVIVTSVLFFRTPVSPINSLGKNHFLFTSVSNWLNRTSFTYPNICALQEPESLLPEFSCTHNWSGLNPSPRLPDCVLVSILKNRRSIATRHRNECLSLEWSLEKLHPVNWCCCVYRL